MCVFVLFCCVFVFVVGVDKFGVVKCFCECMGVLIVDVKNVFVVYDYDVEVVFDYFCVSGFVVVVKKVYCVFVDGVVCVMMVCVNGVWMCVIVEVNLEMDFVVRNEMFWVLARVAATATATRLDEDVAFVSECGMIVDGWVMELSEEWLGVM